MLFPMPPTKYLSYGKAIERFRGPFGESMIRQAQRRVGLEINLWDLRDFTHDAHRTVDDTPYGGGAGMVMKPEPFFEALDYLFQQGVPREKAKVIYPSGVVGDIESVKSDSFEGDLLDAPYYTRPEVYRGLKVPDVLRSGNHQAIERWRLEKRIEKTKAVRPDLYKKFVEKNKL